MPRKVIIDGRTIEFDNDGDVTINLVTGDIAQQLEDALRRATVKGYKETNVKLHEGQVAYTTMSWTATVPRHGQCSSTRFTKRSSTLCYEAGSTAFLM